MTCIVSPTEFPSKKSLREAVVAGREVYIEDPSIFKPWYRPLSDFKPGEEVVVTNHPKRSWFAQVGRTEKGAFYVK